jgi:hypothetical protein
MQRLAFDTIEGMDVDRIPAVFSHDNAELLGGREDVITTVNSLEATVTRSTAFISYGVTNRLDVSLALPVVSADLMVTSDATIQRIGTRVPEIHFFRANDDSICDRRIFTAFGKASGLGDINVRSKFTVRRTQRHGLAVGLDLRMPTGDENKLLGTGAAGIQPFAIWSSSHGAFSPHANVGYQWNGSSVLAGGVASGQARDLPDLGIYNAGAAVELHPRMTFAVDLIGRWIIDSPRVVRQTFRALDGVSEFPDIGFRRGSFHEISAATGFKLNLVDRLLVHANVLVRLNSAGLKDKVSPLFGLEYAF